MLQIRCKNINVTKSFPEGASLLDIYQEFQDEIRLPYPVVSAKVNNTPQGLKFRVYQNRDVEFLDAREGSGHHAYVRSLSFVLYKATQDLFSGSKLFIEHSLCQGYYCNFRKRGGDGLTASEFTQTGGVVEITTGAVGVRSSSSVSVSDGEMSVYSDSIGIYSSTTFTSNGSYVYVVSGGSAVLPPSFDASGNRIPTTAISAGSVTIDGGRIEATATQYAIDTFSLSVWNAEMKLTTSEDAIFVGGSATFTDSDIVIRAGLSFKNDTSPLTRGGINVSGDISFTGGSADISSADNCVTAKSFNAMGTEFKFDASATTVSVSDRATFGACSIYSDNSEYGISAGVVELRSTDADITSNQNAIRTVKTSSLDGSVLIVGGEIKLCSQNVALSSSGDLTINGGLLLMFGKSAALPAVICGGEINVTDGTLAAFDASSYTYSGAGFYCTMQSLVKPNTLIGIHGGSDFLLALYNTYSFRNIYIISSDMIAGNTYVVYTGGKYTGAETYNILTGGTYTPGTVATYAIYQ